MRVIISYPLPFDNWATYRPWVEKFTRTFQQFPPGCDYEVWAVCNWGEPTDEVREWFYGIKTRFIPYYENGCDLGGHNLVAGLVRNINDLVVGMTSRCYLHRAGWLAKLVEVHQTYGGLIGCSASKQGTPEPHLCTRAFAMTSGDWLAYPMEITSRQDGPLFEVGRNNDYGSLLNWYSKHRSHVSVAHWDDVFQLPHEWERYVASKGRFRDGEQNAMLVHDWHTDLYNDASPEKRVEMEMQLRGAP